MSRSEILSWTSLATSTSVVVFYLFMMIGWPDAASGYSSKLVTFFINVFCIAVVIEIFVEISEQKQKVNKDERDLMIEGKGHRIGYSILVFGIMVVLVQLFIALNFGKEMGAFIGKDKLSFLFNVLFITLFVASASKRITMIYNYRKE